MLSWCPRVVIALLCLLTAVDVSANGTSFYDITLASLTSDKPIRLKQYADKVLIISYFEPDCPWCLKQMRDLQTLHNDCPETFQPIAVGVHGSKNALRKMLRRVNITYPAAEATPALVRLTGMPQGTPWSLLIAQQESTFFTLRGYIPYDTLNNGLADLCVEEGS